MNKNVVGGAVVRHGLFVSFVALLVATVFATPAFAAKSDSKKSKPKEPRVERDSGGDKVFRPFVFYGSKSLDDVWDPVTSQTALGFGVTVEVPDWPVQVVVEYYTSDGTGKDENLAPGLTFTGETTEIGIGARKMLESDSDTMKLYVEAGLVQISGKFGAKDSFGGSISDSDSTTGYWLGGGLDYFVSDTVSVGLEARLSSGEVTLFEEPGQAGGTFLGLTLRYHPE